MLRQSSRLTLVQTEPGAAPSCAKARTAACRFDISSAAGTPLPATSAMETPIAPVPKVSMSKQSPPMPLAGCHDEARRRPGICGMVVGKQAALNQPRFLVLALLFRVAALGRLRLLDLALHDLEERHVVPRLLDEAARAAAHRLDRRVDAPPAGHHDDRQRAVVGADAGMSSSPSRPEVVSRL